MKQVLLLTTLLCTLCLSETLAQKKPLKKPAAPAAPTGAHWSVNSFCPDSTRCDRAALWYQAGKGTILLLWKGPWLSVSIRQENMEQLITLGPMDIPDRFRKETAVSEPYPHHVWTDLPQAEGKELIKEQWVITALTRLPIKDEQIQTLRGPQGGTP